MCKLKLLKTALEQLYHTYPYEICGAELSVTSAPRQTSRVSRSDTLAPLPMATNKRLKHKNKSFKGLNFFFEKDQNTKNDHIFYISNYSWSPSFRAQADQPSPLSLSLCALACDIGVGLRHLSGLKTRGTEVHPTVKEYIAPG